MSPHLPDRGAGLIDTPQRISLGLKLINDGSTANLPNWYSSLCWRPVTHAQTWASDRALYRFGRLSGSTKGLCSSDDGFAFRSKSRSNWRHWCSNASTGLLLVAYQPTWDKSPTYQAANTYAQLIIFTCHSSYPMFYNWWLHLRHRSRLCLEQASSRNQICHITTCFQTSTENSSVRLRLTLVKSLKFFSLKTFITIM